MLQVCAALEVLSRSVMIAVDWTGAKSGGHFDVFAGEATPNEFRLELPYRRSTLFHEQA